MTNLNAVKKKLVGYCRELFRRIWQLADRPLRRFASLSGITAQLYYLFCSSSFRRECLATLSGRVEYDAFHREASNTYPLLRRNIHRIEKGIIMRPRRDLFAVGYIDETVEIYERLVDYERYQSETFNPELAWSRDVLRKYFDVTKKDVATETARSKFEAIEASTTASAPELIPYKRDIGQLPPVPFDEFLELCKRRRSVRWFQNVPVPREMLDRAILAAAEAPTACNRQPFSFRIFDSKELIAEAAQIPMGTAGFEHNFPVFGMIVGELSNYTDERDRHLIYIDGSLAAMTFCLAAETMGLSTCLINWPDIEEKERRMEKLLGTRIDQRVVMCFAVGYPDPDGFVPRSTKKPLEVLRNYNEAKIKK